MTTQTKPLQIRIFNKLIQLFHKNKSETLQEKEFVTSEIRPSRYNDTNNYSTYSVDHALASFRPN